MIVVSFLGNDSIVKRTCSFSTIFNFLAQDKPKKHRAKRLYFSIKNDLVKNAKLVNKL
jgi:hypothetical protein